MKEYILSTKKLSKKYRGVPVLSDISIDLERGKIYGLIGQNGAGKTTLMRLLAGLAYGEQGEIQLFSQSGEKELQQQRKRIGTMIEYPCYIPYLSGKENLTYHRMARGIIDIGVEEDLLKKVGLSHAGEKKVKNYSLGMKQRLGIGIALLGNPEILILDEPINGLDPMGVMEIRELMIHLCEENQMTILISSHNLPELYQVATNYIFIHKGRVQQSISLEELDQRCKQHLRIGCLQPEVLASVLEDKLGVKDYVVMPDQTIKLYELLDERERLAKTFYENGIIITQCYLQGDTLENYFIKMIGGQQQ